MKLFLILLNIVFLIHIISMYIECRKIKIDNVELNMNLQELRKIREEQYKNNIDIYKGFRKYVDKFNELARDYLQLKNNILNLEKKYYKEIFSDQYCYKKEYEIYKSYKKNDRKIRLPKKKHPYIKSLYKKFNKEFSESILKDESIDLEFFYKKSDGYAIILQDTLKKCAWIIGMVVSVYVVLKNDPRLLILFLILLTVFVISFIIEDQLNVEGIFIIPIILSIIFAGHFMIVLVINIRQVLLCFLIFYGATGIGVAFCWAFQIYDKQLKEEHIRIERCIKNVKNKINEWNNTDQESDLESLANFVNGINDSLDEIKDIININCKKKNAKEIRKYVETYWDCLFLGECFYGTLNSENCTLNTVSIKNDLEIMNKLANAEWRNRNEVTY